MENGKLIVVEGACDGIGKTTQYEILYKHLLSDGEKIVSHHFPSYGTYHGIPVEKYLSGDFGSPSELSAYFINSLYAVDRGITWYTELRQLYDDETTILLDRYTTSSLIYQSALDYVTDFEYRRIGIKKPDNVIFLYAPFDLVTKIRNSRKENAGIVNDIHESNLEFMKKVYDSAMFVADYLSFDKVQCNDGDKMRDKNDIHEDVYRLVKSRK